MDFGEFKKKALDIKNNLVEAGTKKLVNSNLVINKKKDLKDFIKKSETKIFTSKETGETKEFVRKAIIIFAKKESDFYKKSLIQLPILITKAFSQNIPLKMCNIDIEDLKEYKIIIQPCLVVFETEKVVKIIEGEEKILKIVKGLSPDINKLIEEF